MGPGSPRFEVGVLTFRAGRSVSKESMYLYNCRVKSKKKTKRKVEMRILGECRHSVS
jgi:hypothetical protein